MRLASLRCWKSVRISNYLTDIMPAIHTDLAEKYAGRYFQHPEKMGAQTAEANINAGIAAAKADR